MVLCGGGEGGGSVVRMGLVESVPVGGKERHATKRKEGRGQKEEDGKAGDVHSRGYQGQRWAGGGGL